MGGGEQAEFAWAGGWGEGGALDVGSECEGAVWPVRANYGHR